VSCVDPDTRMALEDTACAGQKPAATQSCKEWCTWIQQDWSSCSVTCGGGTQRADSKCMDRLREVDVNSDWCVGVVGSITQTCNERWCPGHKTHNLWDLTMWPCPSKITSTSDLVAYDDGQYGYRGDDVSYQNSGEDRWMSPKLRRAVHKAYTYVRQKEGSKWRLFIDEAWDQSGSDHSSNSLHYCGNAIDFKFISGAEVLDKGLACKHAWDSGAFDFAAYHQNAHSVGHHCHASVQGEAASWTPGSWGSCDGSSQTRSVRCTSGGHAVEEKLCKATKPATQQSCTTSAPTPPPDDRRRRRRRGSFPPTARTRLQGGEEKSLQDLVLGDHLETVASSGALSSAAFLFDFHAPNSELTRFLRLEHGFGSLLATPEHLIFIRSDADGVAAVPAFRVRVGDQLLVHTGGQSLVNSGVLNISKEWRRGLSAPLTSNGALFVDGVAVSSYGIQHDDETFSRVEAHHWLGGVARHAHRISHFMMWPLRFAYALGIPQAACWLHQAWCDEESAYPGKKRMHWSVNVAQAAFDFVVLRPAGLIG